MRSSRTNRGFTLLELLVAVSILALVSVMAMNLLSAGLRQRDVLTQHDADARQLTRALALLRQDLEAAVPLPLDAEGAVFLSEPDAMSLTRGGLSALGDGQPDQFARVTWRLGPQGSLTRQLGQDAPAITLLDDVTSLALTARGAPSPSVSALPAGFEVTLSHRAHGPLRVVVAR